MGVAGSRSRSREARVSDGSPKDKDYWEKYYAEKFGVAATDDAATTQSARREGLG